MKLIHTVNRLAKAIGELVPEAILNLAARLAVFFVFWLSVQTKLGGDVIFGQKWMFWDVSASTFMLFEYDYALPFVPPAFAAYVATFAEFFFSLLILIGLFTRASALVLLSVTLVIQIFVYPNSWDTHLLWAAGLLYLLKNGGGQLSLDRVFR